MGDIMVYVFNRMREIYETSDPQTIEFVISQYILLNIENIENLTLSKISRDTAISKSAISKYLKKITINSNFALFKNDIKYELGFINISARKVSSDLKLFEDILNRDIAFKLYNNYLNIGVIKGFAEMLYKSDKIIFYGNITKKSYFDRLITTLLLNGKKARFTNLPYSNYENQGLDELTKKDMFIIVEPDNSLYEFNLKRSMSIDVLMNFDKIEARKYYIGKPSSNQNNIKIIEVNFGDNIYINYLFTLIFFHYLFISPQMLEYPVFTDFF